MSDENKGGNEDHKFNLTDDPAFQQLQKSMQGIALLVQNGAQSQKSLQESVTTLVAKLDETAPKPKHVPVEDQEDAVNDMDNVGLMKLIVSEVGKVMDGKLDEVSSNLANTRQSINDTRLAGEVKELMGNHKDLLDWKSEMGALAKDNPNLKIEQLYKLAKIEDPEKATDLDAKYKEESDDGKDKGKGFLSLMPTGGGFNDGEGEKNLTKEEAGDKAWAETIAAFPALAASGDE